MEYHFSNKRSNLNFIDYKEYHLNATELSIVKAFNRKKATAKRLKNI